MHLASMNRPPSSKQDDFSSATRASLLDRLRDVEDQTSWQRFYDKYARLIYGIALKSGLTETEADEVLQETIISVAKHLPAFRYDPKVSSFKSWMLRLTRWRIVSQLRKRNRADKIPLPQDNHETPDELSTAHAPEVLALYEEEWRKTVLPLALEKVKQRVNPDQFQIFDLYALRDMPVGEVASLLGASAAKVYLAKHRVAAMLKQEISALEASGW